MKATASLKPTKWDESTLEHWEPRQQTAKASTIFTLTGEIKGETRTEYILYYSDYDKENVHNSNATYVGLSRFIGTIGNRKGTFVMEDHGTFKGGAADSRLTIVEGSGTGELAGISGKGTYTATANSSGIEIEYEL